MVPWKCAHVAILLFFVSPPSSRREKAQNGHKTRPPMLGRGDAERLAQHLWCSLPPSGCHFPFFPPHHAPTIFLLQKTALLHRSQKQDGKRSLLPAVCLSRPTHTHACAQTHSPHSHFLLFNYPLIPDCLLFTMTMLALALLLVL